MPSRFPDPDTLPDLEPGYAVTHSVHDAGTVLVGNDLGERSRLTGRRSGSETSAPNCSGPRAVQAEGVAESRGGLTEAVETVALPDR